MKSIFSRTPQEPSFQKAIIDSETSILKRLNIFIEETTNKWKSNNDWIRKTGDQVNELLTRTFDLQSKVESQIIEVESTTSKKFHSYDDKIDKFEKRLGGKYVTVEDNKSKFDEVSDIFRDISSKVSKLPSDIKSVENKIPTNVVSKDVLEGIVTEFRSNLEKVANAIPKNVASNDLVSDIRREIIEMFHPYVTSDALRLLERKNKTEIAKVEKSLAVTSKASKKTVNDFNILASKVEAIKEDYVSTSLVPKIKSDIANTSLQLTNLINEVNSKIPTDYAKNSDIDDLRYIQLDILKKLEDHKSDQNSSMDERIADLKSIMDKPTKKVEEDIKNFQNSLAEYSMGEDSNFMKNIIRGIADDEIKNLRSSNSIFQENVATKVFEIKNQNRNLALKMNEIQSNFDKLIKLARTK
tara:strand:- start:1006 stop:2241 length:1236 start_codon:yes stop_codon:yes gene_type:complete